MLSSLFARAVALVGAAVTAVRRLRGVPRAVAVGATPIIPDARPQGALPTLKMPTARGWRGAEAPIAASGLRANLFAGGLKHPRWIEVLANGDVLVAEAMQQAGPPRSVFDYAMQSTMRRARALGDSPNRITRLRDADGDGVAERAEIFLKGLDQPFGMAVIGATFYAAPCDGVLAFPYDPATATVAGAGRRIARFKPGGHWTRSLIASPDGKTLFAGVGSLSNIAEAGFEVEEGRACIYAIDVETESVRIHASGLRNPVGMAFEPTTGALWTVVNERDGLGDETPPDYLTSVREGGFYGWPYAYWGQTVDDRVPQDPAMVTRALRPDYALGGHTASLGLCWVPEGTLPGFGAGMAIGQHGSWNRSTLSGYRVIHVPFENGRPAGPPRDVLTGFLSGDERDSYGRPVGVAVGPDRRSLLVADDVGDVIWRVAAA